MGCEPIGSCTRLTGMTVPVSLVIYGCLVPGSIGAAILAGVDNDSWASSAYAMASPRVMAPWDMPLHVNIADIPPLSMCVLAGTLPT